jgi:hypothetical protein
MNKTAIIILLACVIIGGVFYTWGSDRLERRARRKMLRSRPSLTSHEIYESVGRHDLEEHAVIAAWNEVSDILCVEPGLLRAGDELCSLRPLRIALESDIDTLEGHLIHRLGTFPPVATIRDVVLLLSTRTDDEK